MKRDRTQIFTGARMTGGGCPVEHGPIVKRDMVERGMFLRGGTIINTIAPPRYGVDLTEIGERMDALQRRIDALRARRS